ncbi:unnamed protein product [Caenorhabditis nigoni]|uniref:Uncharacterized protein n=1 Tax=Caenorhabditis nigoni TaxID=1611254 RepID=A0A2G5STM4_9PELO|nr:hypothetical protein B9Z55_024233 [Caenorhabditis nigoni]
METGNSVVHVSDLQDDLKEFMCRAQRRTHRDNLRQVKEYKSKMVSETSVFNRVPLDGGAVLSIYTARDRTFDLIKRLMKLVMCQEVLVALRDYLKVCNHLEIRLQSLIYHIAQCPQYDLEIKDITAKLDVMERIVGELEEEHKSDGETNEELLKTCGVLTSGDSQEDEEEGDDDHDKFEDAREN